MSWPQVLPLGDRAITLRFANERNPELLGQIHGITRALNAARLPDVDEIVPAYLTLTVFYDPLKASFSEMRWRVLDAIDRANVTSNASVTAREHIIPVRYNGPDIEEVARQCGISTADVVAIHSGQSYTVDFLGFVPGFAYMSELDPRLQLPRRTQPRPRVAAGSVAIAGPQTAVYPLDTPGGWHLLGATSMKLFDPARDSPALLAPGDIVKFEKET